MVEKLAQYFAANKMHCFEGSRGVTHMEKTINEVCGYDSSWGGTLSNFFSDNPGAIQAVIEWIGDQRVEEWQSNLDQLVGEETSEETSEE